MLQATTLPPIAHQLTTRCRKHTNVVTVLVTAAQAAGLHVKWEPDTYGLLLGQFSKAECRRIFPRQASKEYDAKFEDVMSTLLSFSESKDTTLLQQQVLLEEKVRALPELKPDDTTGLRLDLSITDPVTQETKWIDATICHTTSPSYLKKETENAIARQLSLAIATEHQLPDLKQFEPSPTLLQRENKKAEKYARLIAIANKQHREGRRPKAPQFIPFVLADSGEYSPQALDLQEWLVSRYKESQRRITRTDGVPLTELVRSYRQNLRVSIQLALAAGIGAMLLTAGHPFQGLGV